MGRSACATDRAGDVTATIFAGIFPVFALVALGFLCGRANLLGEGADRVLNAFVASITLPVLTFHVLATMEPGDFAEPVMFAVVVGASYAVFVLHFLIERFRGLDAPRSTIAALGAAFGNTAFIGLPVCLAILGPASLAPSAVIMALNTLFVFGGGAIVTSFAGAASGAASRRLASALRLVATNPLVVGAFAGVAIAMADINIPAPVDELLRILSAATAPCALIAIGLFISRPVPAPGGSGATWRSIAGKLLFLPLTTMVMLALLPPLPPLWRDTALIMSGVPAGASCFVLARESGEAALHIAARVIVYSTIGAAFTLPPLLYLIRVFA